LRPRRDRTTGPVMTRTPIEPAPAIFTDLYELTMAQAYLAEGMVEPADGKTEHRRLPAERNFLLACGLGTLLDDLESLRFTPDELRYLESLGRFTPDFLDWLERFRFTGTVHAVAEGTPVFAEEPLVEIEAPLPEAQLIETLVLNRIHLQTLIASKGVRVVLAAQGRRVVDFGARRMHGIEAALAGARAFHIAASMPPPTCSPASVSACRSPGRWRTATSRPTTTRRRRSPRSPRSIPTPCCWSTPTTRRAASSA
jgi:nicotinate phosphoribosyltransferase